MRVVSGTLDSRVEALIRVSSIPPTSAGLIFSKSLVSRGNSTWWVKSQCVPNRSAGSLAPRKPGAGVDKHRAEGKGGCRLRTDIRGSSGCPVLPVLRIQTL